MRFILRKILPQNSAVYRMIRRCYHWCNNIWLFDILSSYVAYKRSVHFIQIGSNDGKHGDPIFPYIRRADWKGILVEPVPYLFERLKSNYVEFGDKLLFENSAIANESGRLKFYRLQASEGHDLPEWYDQLGSFKKDVVLRHKNWFPSFDDLFIEDTVNAITFPELLKKHKVETLNLIHIDTEGYDYEIIKTIPFDDIEIDLVMFEHRHLPAREYRQAVKLLNSKGFRVQKNNNSDTTAIKKHILNQLHYHKKGEVTYTNR